MPLYLSKGIFGPLDGAYTSDSTLRSCGFISSSHKSVRLSTFIIYQYIQYSVSTCHKLFIDLVSSEISTSRSYYYTCFCACLVMLYFSFTLSYMLSTFQVLTHTCSVQVLSIQITHRRFLDLQFSRFSGESSFSEDNNHEFHFSL